MPPSLPDKPSLEHLKKQAKDLHKAHKAGDHAACETLRRLNRFAEVADEEILAADVPLREVQFALAMDYGFRSWEHLKAYVEAITPPTADQQQDVQVRPIRQDELDRIVLRCWPPDRDELLRLFDEQGTIGMAAWEGPKCVGVVHGYRRDDPRKPSHLAPPWARGRPMDDLPPATREAALSLPAPIWSFSCYHVGRTLVSFREEFLSLVHRVAPRNSWDPVRTTAALNQLDAVKLEVRQVEAMIEELRRTGARKFVVDEPRYYSRGIGTALCRASVEWARHNGYAAVDGGGAPAGLFKFAVWAGSLPHTTYTTLGFRTLGPFEPEDQLPGWARGDSPPDVMRQVEDALREGRPTATFHSQLMALLL